MIVINIPNQRVDATPFDEQCADDFYRHCLGFSTAQLFMMHSKLTAILTNRGFMFTTFLD
jgi:hypothetical protein